MRGGAANPGSWGRRRSPPEGVSGLRVPSWCLCQDLNPGSPHSTPTRGGRRAVQASARPGGLSPPSLRAEACPQVPARCRSGVWNDCSLVPQAERLFSAAFPQTFTFSAPLPPAQTFQCSPRQLSLLSCEVAFSLFSPPRLLHKLPPLVGDLLAGVGVLLRGVGGPQDLVGSPSESPGAREAAWPGSLSWASGRSRRAHISSPCCPSPTPRGCTHTCLTAASPSGWRAPSGSHFQSLRAQPRRWQRQISGLLPRVGRKGKETV